MQVRKILSLAMHNLLRKVIKTDEILPKVPAFVQPVSMLLAASFQVNSWINFTKKISRKKYPMPSLLKIINIVEDILVPSMQNELLP